MNSGTPAEQITAETKKKIRTFLYELSEGATNYRSLHSLNEQIGHQYHGRVVIELIQNAHDALAKGKRAGRIELVLRAEEGIFGTLYVANDGACFSASNFESLSQLGQSDKTPEQSIGNKGIGFRSVLEITVAPEIYSRLDADSAVFDGFCFTFSPSIIGRLADPVVAILRGEPADQLVDWNEQLLSKFRATVGERGEAWLRAEVRYLSPYLLPEPIEAAGAGSMVTEFERRGFATVIRLPLKAAGAAEILRQKLRELNSNTLLFLNRASSLLLDDGVVRKELSRESADRPGSLLVGTDVLITETASGFVQRFWLWSRDLAIVNAPDNVRESLKNLPGRWPELTHATVSLAVALADESQPGVLSIFLPTLLRSGCGANINAPFFGDMNRTGIDFSNDYNEFLLEEAAGLALQVIRDELAGRGLDEARAIIDLLAPCGSDADACSRWQAAYLDEAAATGVKFDEMSWFFSDQGWRTLGETSLVPESVTSSVITHDALRAHARFPAFVAGLDSRAKPLCALAAARRLSIYPLPSHLADTVEAMARSLLFGPEISWSGFWLDAESLFKGDSSPLNKKQVLLGNDGQLHASDENCTVFFSARQGGLDDEEVGSGSDTVPASLTRHIAFLNERVVATDEKGPRHPTKVRRFLESNLVNRFRVEDIFRQVLIRRAPPLPLGLDDAQSALCRDILLWGLRLMAHLVDRGKAEKSLRLLRELPVPCQGGWMKLGESSFGAGWPDTQGEVLLNYLNALSKPHSEEARARLLLPPTDIHWDGEGFRHQKLMRLAGVFDGLRLSIITPKEWSSTFHGSPGCFAIPPTPPPGVGGSLWGRYVEHVKATATPHYQGWFPYQAQELSCFDGFAAIDDLEIEARAALMNILLGSVGAWGTEWRRLSFLKKEGNSDRPEVESPLAFALRNLPWLGLQKADVLEWFRPTERWHVPAAALAGRAWQFDHLKPLPGSMANRLDKDPLLSETLYWLGMPRFDPDVRSPSTRLLNDLAHAVERRDVPDRNVFLGQARSAWGAFYPNSDTPFPSLLIVNRGGGPLTAERASMDNPIYLRDSTKLFAALEQFDLPVLAILTGDAQRLAATFTTAFGGAVRITSALKLVALVQDAQWLGPVEERLHESAMEHLIPMLLMLAAFAGSQPRGTSSKRFQEQISNLRGAMFRWVPDLKIALCHGETKLADPNVDALWLPEEGVLLATEKCRCEPVLLGEALAHLLERDDLESPIQLLLQGFSSIDPSGEEVARSLRLLKLSPEHLQEVREHWRGDLSQAIRRILPLLSLLRPEATLGGMLELQTDLELERFLDALQDARFTGSSIIRLCRASTDLFEFGKSAWRHFGAPVQLSAWNALSAQRGEPLLLNNDAGTDFRRHLVSAQPILRSLLATIVRRNPPAQSYKLLWAELEAVRCPPGFETDFWEVEFQQVVASTLPFFGLWGASAAEIEAIHLAISYEDFEARLHRAGVDVSSNPLETARANREKLREALTRLQQIGLAWALASHHVNPASWEARVEGYASALSHELEGGGYLTAWTEPKVFSLLRTLPQDEASESFWKTLNEAQNFQELIEKTGLTAESLAQAQERLQTFKEDLRRKSRLVQVGGKEFDNSEDNLAHLYEHIRSMLPDDRMINLAAIDLRRPILPKPLARNTRTGNTREAIGPRPKVKRPSKLMENLVGLAGEIHAYRMLNSRYNAGPGSWLSENGRVVFPENMANDGRGCDFEIVHRDRTYFIEVKASEGEDQGFTLGSSEIRLAMELARKKRPHSKVAFFVLHVTRALSDAPSFKLLPNPYDPIYQSLFLMDGADVRIRYRAD